MRRICHKMKTSLLALACSVVLAGQASFATEAPNPPFKWVETETLVGTLPDGRTPYLLSPDQRRVAYQVKDGERTYAELEGKRYCVSDFSTVRFTPDSQHLTYVVQDVLGACLAVDGKEERTYKSLQGLTFSPDGKSWAYVGTGFDADKNYGGSAERNPFTPGELQSRIDARRVPTLTPCSVDGAKPAKSDKPKAPDFWSCLVVNGKEGPRFSNITYFVFSPDWSHRAYVVRWAQGATLIVDDREIGTYRALDENSIVFSQDGKRFGCVAGDGEQFFVVVDGKEGPRYHSQPSVPVFSPDGQRVAYWVKEGDFVTVVVDGQPAYKGGGAEARGTILFSPDSRHWAVEIDGGGSARVVLDGVEQKAYRLYWRPSLQTHREHGRSVLPNSITFTQDGHLRYIATDDRRWFDDCVDGAVRNRCQSVSEVAYGQGLESQAYFGGDGKVKTLVLNGKAVPLRHPLRPGTLGFSPDGKQYAFVSYLNPNTSRGQCLTLDAIEGGEHDCVVPESVTFSPSGGDTAYFAKDNERLRLVWKGGSAPANEWSNRKSISFSPDDKHLAYQPTEHCLVADNQEGKQYDEVFLKDDKIAFDAGDCFHYLARRLNNFYLVEARCVPVK